ncbi:MAG: hypothetical protein JW712_08085 [Dehalococcoidales bacterium]|nr:hypothetical protein [Dehalococcoidales bacterium]
MFEHRNMITIGSASRIFLLLVMVVPVTALVLAVSACDKQENPARMPVSSNLTCSEPGEGFIASIDITDAYCEYGDTVEFPFRFTLQNLTNEDMDTEYTWTLDDPMAGQPLYSGEDKATVPALGSRTIEITVEKKRYSDSRYYTMSVCTSRDDIQTGYYREQKSTYDWDYSFSPPVRREVKDHYKHLWISTLVEKNGFGYKVTVMDILFIPEEWEVPLLLDTFYVALDYSTEVPMSPSLADMTESKARKTYDLAFTDTDKDGELSVGDYLTMSGKAKGAGLFFVCRDDPSFQIYQRETIEEEDPDSLMIDSVEWTPCLGEKIELSLEVISKNSVPRVGPQIILASKGGFGSVGFGIGEPEQQGDSYTYTGALDYTAYHLKNEPSDSLHLLLEVSDGTNEILRYLGRIE